MKIDITQTHDILGAYKSIDYSKIKENYQDEGTQYCFEVLDGKIIAGYYSKLACFRHLQDLTRQNTTELPYYSTDEVRKILLFASIYPEMRTKKPIKLMSWQKFLSLH